MLTNERPSVVRPIPISRCPESLLVSTQPLNGATSHALAYSQPSPNISSKHDASVRDVTDYD